MEIPFLVHCLCSSTLEMTIYYVHQPCFSMVGIISNILDTQMLGFLLFIFLTENSSLYPRNTLQVQCLHCWQHLLYCNALFYFYPQPLTLTCNRPGTWTWTVLLIFMFAVSKVGRWEEQNILSVWAGKKKKSHKEHRNPPQKDLDSTQNKWAINKKNNLKAGNTSYLLYSGKWNSFSHF